MSHGQSIMTELEEERREILAASCDDFIRKPFARVFEALSRHLRLQYQL